MELENGDQCFGAYLEDVVPKTEYLVLTSKQRM